MDSKPNPDMDQIARRVHNDLAAQTKAYRERYGPTLTWTDAPSDSQPSQPSEPSPLK
jgi:hypothetical protein